MEIGNIAEHNKGFRYLLNCIDIYTVCKNKNGRILKLLFQDGVGVCRKTVVFLQDMKNMKNVM